MAKSAHPTPSNLAEAFGIHRLDGARLARRQTVNRLRNLGFDESFIDSSMKQLDSQIRSTGKGQVLMADFRKGPFGPMAIVETL